MENTALITGASGGIGQQLARIHAAKKGDLVLVARRTTVLQKIKAELEEKEGVRVVVIPKDLSIPDAAQEVYETLEEREIEIHYLINNAGVGTYGLFHDTDWESTEIMLNLNILALTQLTSLFGTQMVARGAGRIMNVSSTAAFQPGPLMSVYYATKHYVNAFSEGLHNEWKDFGVTVTTLCPGPTATGFQAAAEMEGSRLVKGKNLPTAKEVAQYGYEAMMKGKMTAVHGAANSFLAATARFIPKKLLLKAVRKMQEKTR